MFPRLALLPLGLFVIWCFVCQRWYVCHIKQKCEAQIEQPHPPTVDNRPIVFNWSISDPVTRPTFEAYRDSILKGLPEGNFFEITGLYAEDEFPAAGFGNLGLARGEKMKALFSQFIPAERIVVSSDLLKEQVDSTSTAFIASRFSYRKPPEDQGKKTVECLEQQGGGLTILFPYGKAQNEVDKKIEDCLSELVAFMNDNPDATVEITGHTDSSGSQEFNMELGTERARHIMGFLTKKGIAKNRVSIASKGEDQPVASNDTEEGSRLNRRAVLVLKKKSES